MSAWDFRASMVCKNLGGVRQLAERGRPRSTSKYPDRICEVCGGDFKPNRKSQKHCKSSCSLELAHKRQTEKWRDFRRRANYLGYWEIKLDDGTWVSESRYRYEQYHGFKLPSSVYVGFRDGNRDNMSKENLCLKNSVLDKAVRETGKLPKLVNGKPPKISRTDYRRQYYHSVQKPRSQHRPTQAVDSHNAVAVDDDPPDTSSVKLLPLS